MRFRKEPPGHIRRLVSGYQYGHLVSKRRRTSGGVGVDIDTFPCLTSAWPRGATHGEAGCALGFATTAGWGRAVGTFLEMAALAIALHKVVRASASSGPLGRESQIAVRALKVARIGVGAKSAGMIGVSALRAREGLYLQEMFNACTAHSDRKPSPPCPR